MLKKLCAVVVFGIFGGQAFADDLTIEQHVIGMQMNETVLTRGILNRLHDLCADVVVDEEALAVQRDQIMSLAQQHFASQEAFMDAAGANERYKTGEDMRRFFFERGVVWDSSPEEYCTLASSLIDVQSPLSAFFKKR